MNVRFAGICAAALLLGAAPAQTPGLDQIVARHVAALGGMTRILAIRSVVERGRYVEGTEQIDTYAAQMRPFYRVIGDPSRGLQDIREGYDGSAWEFYPDPGIVVRTVGPAARATRHAAPIDDVLVSYGEHGTVLTLEGTRQVLGQPCYVLHAVLYDGFAEDVFVNVRTFMIDGEERVVPMHAFGKRYTTLDAFSDYRPEGGVMRAHAFREVDEQTGKSLTESFVTSVDINPDLHASMFHPPDWDRTPLQSMIQRIFEERTEPEAVMATYRDFRTLVDVRSKAASDAIDFVGYQCLKMGQVETTVALLAQNVSENPNSARAHFGLGRAYVASGRKNEARAQYRAALALDPDMRRAQSALDDLH